MWSFHYRKHQEWRGNFTTSTNKSGWVWQSLVRGQGELTLSSCSFRFISFLIAAIAVAAADWNADVAAIGIGTHLFFTTWSEFALVVI